MATYPAVDITGADANLIFALVDDYSPTAAEEHGHTLTLFFHRVSDRDAACSAIRGAWPLAALAVRDVDDEDWARRSQQSLTPIAIGRLIVAPPWGAPTQTGSAADRDGGLDAPPGATPITVVIQPSMGFGTGHHATTRLCLDLLQRIDLRGKSVLDVGTGSGVLAIAARLFGAEPARGIDCDPDAVQSATDNLALNPGASGVVFELTPLDDVSPSAADIVVANLTGALLARSERTLTHATRAGGTLVLSGVLTSEREMVIAAFGSSRIRMTLEEDGWVGLTVSADT